MNRTKTLSLCLAILSTGLVPQGSRAAELGEGGGTYSPPPEHYSPPPEHYTPKPQDDGGGLPPETRCTKVTCR
jgi:hypothetical protein